MAKIKHLKGYGIYTGVSRATAREWTAADKAAKKLIKTISAAKPRKR